MIDVMCVLCVMGATAPASSRMQFSNESLSIQSYTAHTHTQPQMILSSQEMLLRGHMLLCVLGMLRFVQLLLCVTLMLLCVMVFLCVEEGFCVGICCCAYSECFCVCR